MMHINIDPCMITLGPLAIQWYGFFVLLGMAWYLYWTRQEPFVQKYLGSEGFDRAVALCMLSGIGGARLVHVITDFHQYSTPTSLLWWWQGGLSMWGAVLGIIGAAGFIVRRQPMWLQILDDCTRHAPWAHAIARWGCFTAGCCHGIASSTALAVVYGHPATLALELGVAYVPTQLISSACFILLGLGIYLSKGWLVRAPGSTLCVYILGVALERFCVDWWRADRIMHIPWLNFTSSILSFHQYVSVALMVLMSFALYRLRTHGTS